jgi:hypothetical protein
MYFANADSVKFDPNVCIGGHPIIDSRRSGGMAEAWRRRMPDAAQTNPLWSHWKNGILRLLVGWLRSWLVPRFAISGSACN